MEKSKKRAHRIAKLLDATVQHTDSIIGKIIKEIESLGFLEIQTTRGSYFVRKGDRNHSKDENVLLFRPKCARHGNTEPHVEHINTHEPKAMIDFLLDVIEIVDAICQKKT